LLNIELITVLISVSGVIILIAQLFMLIKNLKADHERRKKQSTIEYMNKIRDIYRPIDTKLTQKHGSKALNPEDIDEADMADMREFLSVLEHLSVGVNSYVYDILLVNRMSGTFLLDTLDKVKPYIKYSRKERSSKTLYEEFENMCKDIKSLRDCISNEGKIIHS
jgi:hypothetical protein